MDDAFKISSRPPTLPPRRAATHKLAAVAGALMVSSVFWGTAAPALADDIRPPNRVFSVEEPQAQVATADDPISNIIYLNRCTGGCVINKTDGASDARTNTSSIPKGAASTYNVAEWNQSEEIWQQVVSCVREVYAPYDIEIVTEDPGAVVHHEAIVAGAAADIGWGADGALGVGSVRGDCSAINNGISFTFANEIPSDVNFMCATIAQESAHTFGLDHELECTDPMTYIEGCGRKYFRNLAAMCGEYPSMPRQCGCGGRQNSHVRMLGLFGYNDIPMEAPTATIVSPADGDPVANNFPVFVQGEQTRGVAFVELWLNGYKWATKDDYDFASQGGTYTLNAPAGVPDGRIDIEARVYNDLGNVYGSANITVQKGALCQNAATDCAVGQECDAEGRCFWEPATANLGDACEYPQACITGECRDSGNGVKACTESCFSGTADACPTGFQCVTAGGAAEGLCFAGTGSDGGGCCSTSNESGMGTVGRLALGGLVLGALVWPRRRRRARA